LSTVLVTGGLGFIGRSLAHELRMRGKTVRILDNQLRGNAKYLEAAEENYELVLGDIREREVVKKAVEGCSEIYHLAAINGTKNFYNIPRQVLEVGVIGTHLLLDESISQGIKKFLFMSSSEVYQTPKVVPTDESVGLYLPDAVNPRYSYGGSKIAGELMTMNYCRDAMEKAIVVRPHNVYGPNMGFDHVVPELAMKILKARKANPQAKTVDVPLEGNGAASRSFVFIDDFVTGTLLAMDKGEHLHTYHVGTDQEISILDLAKRIARALEIDTNFVPSGLPSGGTMRRCPDISRLRSLGYEPQVELDRGLEMALKTVRDHFDQM
jgi:nucleoside-diphosphate-sugar epimerase